MKKRLIYSLSVEDLKTCAALLYDIVDPTCEEFSRQIEIAQRILGLEPPRPVSKKLLSPSNRRRSR